MSADDPVKEVENLVSQLRRKVAERRMSGEYPPGFEEALDEHFKRIVFHRVDRDTEELEDHLKKARAASYFDLDRISTDSGVVGGERLHRTIKKAISRQTTGMMDQFQDFANEVRDTLTVLTAAVQDGTMHVHTDLIRQIDSILERLDSYERAPVEEPMAVRDLRRRVEELERAEAARTIRPEFDEAAFEKAFAGEPTVAQLKELRAFVSDLAGTVLVFGSLKSNVGVPTQQATFKDLRASADKSVAGIIVVDEFERMAAQQQLDFVRESAVKLRAGGRFVVRARDPRLHDVAHPAVLHPVPPAYLTFVLEQAGFRSITSSPGPVSDQLEPVSSSASPGNRNVKRLNDVVFRSADYLVTAIR